MNIKNLFKKSTIVMVVAGMAIAGAASAGLVNYLSNGVSAGATITSPITMNINPGIDGTVTDNKTVSVSAFGGSDFQFTTVAKNLSTTNSITGYRVIVITAPDNAPFTGGEVAKVTFQNATLPTTPGYDITSKLVVVNPDGTLTWLASWSYPAGVKRLVLITSSDSGVTADKDTLTAGEVDWNGFTMTSNAAITPGTYTIYSQFVPNLAKFATEVYNNTI